MKLAVTSFHHDIPSQATRSDKDDFAVIPQEPYIPFRGSQRDVPMAGNVLRGAFLISCDSLQKPFLSRVKSGGLRAIYGDIDVTIICAGFDLCARSIIGSKINPGG